MHFNNSNDVFDGLMSSARSFRLRLDAALPVRFPRFPLILIHLHQIWNTQTAAFNCECLPLCYLCPSMSTRKPVHMCARPFPPSFCICHFLCYICSKVSIWYAGLDLVASNKHLFQCCLCSGPHRRQPCGWPPGSPQGEPYIWLVLVTDHSWWRSPTHGHKVVP